MFRFFSAAKSFHFGECHILYTETFSFSVHVYVIFWMSHVGEGVCTNPIKSSATRCCQCCKCWQTV